MLGIKNLLFHASAENIKFNQGPAAYALQMASVFDAHLSAVVYELDVYAPKSIYGRSIAEEAKADIETRNQEARLVADKLKEAAKNQSISADILTEKTQAALAKDAITQHARLHDFCVTGVDDSGLLGETGIAEHLLFQSGRPIIIVPNEWQKIFSTDKIVIAWDYSRTAARALADALPFLADASQITLLVIEGEKQIKNRLQPEETIQTLAHRGIDAVFETAALGKRSIAGALQDEAESLNADMLVMGGFGHSRFREFVLGGATREIFRNARLPILMSH